MALTLILIDLQEWIVERYAPDDGMAAAVAAEQARCSFRASGDLVIHVRHLALDGSDGGPDSPRTRFVDAVTVEDGEPIVNKHDRSAFANTPLDGMLRDRGVRDVVLAGLVTEGGIASTAVDALRLGYRVSVLLPAIAGNTPQGHREALNDLRNRGVTLRDWI
ncbi:cysteine hydrolase family protein [Nonomuraea typhae]|uniref:cysteine hydrolase family protein n=1 Tax=Nonomuraea typhae TaxID=2603600 RepID=UPI0012FBA055|nr:cysteine hydrolase [Nonomuraea typhae]